MDAVETPEFMTVEEAARLLRMDRKTVYRAVKAGNLVAVRVGRQLRIDRKALLADEHDDRVARALTGHMALLEETGSMDEALRRAGMNPAVISALARDFTAYLTAAARPETNETERLTVVGELALIVGVALGARLKQLEEDA